MTAKSGFVELESSRQELTFSQRWSHYLTIGFGIVGLLIGVFLRDSALLATVRYTNNQAGITAEYPANWLIDESGDYILRVRDISRRGFKTTVQVSVRPVNVITSARNVFDALNLNRSQTLAAYEVLSEELFTLPNEVPATAMTYTFVDTQDNPFLQSLPVVVRGLDILTIRGGQALVITLLADAADYEQAFVIFERFISSLEF